VHNAVVDIHVLPEPKFLKADSSLAPKSLDDIITAMVLADTLFAMDIAMDFQSLGADADSASQMLGLIILEGRGEMQRIAIRARESVGRQSQVGIPDLVWLSEHGNSSERALALSALLTVESEPNCQFEYLSRALSDNSEHVRHRAISSLSHFAKYTWNREVACALEPVLFDLTQTDSSELVRRYAKWTIQNWEDKGICSMDQPN
jgi:hypothetical protein